MPVFSLPFSVALLVGATLAATDPAILIPLFDRLRLRPKVSQTVIAESAFNDATATVLVLTVAGVVEAGNVGATEPLTDFSKSLVLGAALGIGGGLLLAAMLSSHAVGIWRESPAVAILADRRADVLHDRRARRLGLPGRVRDGADRRQHGAARPGHGTPTTRKQLDDFMTQASEIAVLAVFVTLGINLPLDALWDNLWGGLVVMVVFLFVARPLTVLACLLPDRRGRWTREEIVFLSWCRETGVVPAAIAGVLLARGVEGAEIVAAMVALAVVTTLLVQATTAGVARAPPRPRRGGGVRRPARRLAR